MIDLYVLQDGFDGHLARGLARTEWFASDSPMCLNESPALMVYASLSCPRCETSATSAITHHAGKALIPDRTSGTECAVGFITGDLDIRVTDDVVQQPRGIP